MKCVGTPQGPCPYNATGASVHFRYAELDLCSPCEKVQREDTMKANESRSPSGNQLNKTISSTKSQQSNTKASQMKPKENTKSVCSSDANVNSSSHCCQSQKSKLGFYVPFNSQGHIGTGPQNCHLWDSNPQR